MDPQEFQVFHEQISNYGFQSSINESNYDHLIDLIRGENAEEPILTNFNPNYDGSSELLMFNGGLVDNQFAPASMLGDMFTDFNSINNSNPNSTFNSLPPFSEEDEIIREEEENDNDGYNSSATTTTSTKNNVDRSRTLVSERRRRGRMKEKLYALRSLVPNITKMDKASIVGDAVQYVQELQMEAKKLKTEISGLESSLKGGVERLQGLVDKPKKIPDFDKNHLSCRKIVEMDVFQVEERSFYVRLASIKGEGVAVALHKALESLTCFDVQNSNISTVCDKLVLTCSLNVREFGEEMNMSTLKIWVTGALLNQGFEFKTPVL
ncbi:transcription factor FER-LIKE IRON DEFICIENCY-INDUCED TRANSCRIPTION FACTOR-like [Macadamia integrifolia]|uniref:transcription factor FER-LIKE IRON DEFICIENCY-INDUCED TRANSCRIPTION FACTOR-like n=1 Tax=Macadamia integrifolia TaxID=60698 RepID=UPI001C500A85|nr:transcription factor FER-LIKE IRON DEFICIENCY-INDUCED TRANSCRIPTION FACTOR-like [Macadamia integrifolia]